MEEIIKNYYFSYKFKALNTIIFQRTSTYKKERNTIFLCSGNASDKPFTVRAQDIWQNQMRFSPTKTTTTFSFYLPHEIAGSITSRGGLRLKRLSLPLFVYSVRALLYQVPSESSSLCTSSVLSSTFPRQYFAALGGLADMIWVLRCWNIYRTKGRTI